MTMAAAGQTLCTICRKAIKQECDSSESSVLLLAAYCKIRKIDDKSEQRDGIDFSADEQDMSQFNRICKEPVYVAISLCSRHQNHLLCLEPCAINFLAAAMTDKCPICRESLSNAAQTVFDAFYNKRLYQNLASHIRLARTQFGQRVEQEQKKLCNRICQKDVDLYQKSKQQVAKKKKILPRRIRVIQAS